MMLNQGQPLLGPLWAIGGHFRMWRQIRVTPESGHVQCKIRGRRWTPLYRLALRRMLQGFQGTVSFGKARRTRATAIAKCTSINNFRVLLRAPLTTVEARCGLLQKAASSVRDAQI